MTDPVVSSYLIDTLVDGDVVRLSGSSYHSSILLFLCSYIFRYGEELQQLSDETV